MPTTATPANGNAKVIPLRPDQEIVIRRRAEEREFLPAMLEVVETPASPTWRITALTLCTLLSVAVAWTCFAKIDIVAIAPGKIVPIGQVKVVQPLETATIRTIRVDDGDHVRAGDPLVELDPTEAQADLASLRYDRSQALLDAAVANFLLAGDEDGAFGPAQDVEQRLVIRNRRQALEELRKFRADLAAIDAQMAEKRAALTANAAQIERARALIPLMNDRYDTMRALYEQHISPKPPMLDAEQNLVERQSDLKAALGTADEIEAETASLTAKRVQTASAFLTDAMDRRTKAEEREAELDGQITKIEQKARDRRLTAPVNGTVQNVKIHTPGAVVTIADTLMTIVPDGTGIEVEANVANDDIGFVHEGELTEVKFDAFPFTRYGLIRGTLLHLSRDAEPTSPSERYEDHASSAWSGSRDNSIEAQSMYRAKVRLSQDWISVDGQKQSILPGMHVSVEIKTGERSVASYVLSPVLQVMNETGHEYLPTGWLDAAGAVWSGSMCNEGLRGLLKADSLVA